MNISLYRPLPTGIGWVTQWFGEQAVDYSIYGLAGHNGLDYGAPIGTPVLAAHGGVCRIGHDPAGYGEHIRITDGQIQTIYAHLSEFAVEDGQTVQAGEMIGKVGSTGNSTGPHLHFGLKILTGRNPAYLHWIDPVPFRDV